MAEDAREWDLLTGSLAACDLADLDSAWAFLVLQGLVIDSTGNRAEFARVVEKQLAIGDYEGPTIPRRIALWLEEAGVLRPAAGMPDPFGKIAAARWAMACG